MFTNLQQKSFRSVVARAWQRACQLSGLAHNDKAARDAWYHSELVNATGYSSTLDCNSGRDFEAAIAHFETLAEDDITWQMRTHGADARRVMHAAREVAADLHKKGFETEAVKAASFESSEAYLLALGKKTSGRGDVTRLEDFAERELVNIVICLKRHLRRLAPSSTRRKPSRKVANA